jgi:predicted RNA-binding Zn ribbon-like protein
MITSSSAAPRPLETVRGLVNTRDIESDVDALTTTGELRDWLHTAGLLDPAAVVSAADLRRAVALREALREALLANHANEPVPEPALALFNEVAARADLTLSLTNDLGWLARPRTGGVDGALGSLLVIVADAMADGTWRRLKVCANQSCQWAFYDQSRARSGRWCSMQVCGNRAKQHAWRARRQDGAEPG